MVHPFEVRALRTPPLDRNGDGWIVRQEPGVGLPIEYVVRIAGEPAFGLQPLTPFRLDHRPIGNEEAARLSPHAVQRRFGSELIWEDVAVLAQLRTYGATSECILKALASHVTANSLSQRFGLPNHEVRRCLELLLCGGLIRRADHPSFRSMWSAREAWIHAQTALGRVDGVLGGTFPFRGVMDAPPARPSARIGARTELPRADLPEMSLQQALKTRRSRRTGQQPLDLSRLGCLLWHSARVTSLAPGGDYEVRRHSYPTGGGLGELEIYVVVSRSEAIEAGLFHYDAFDHCLTRIDADKKGITALETSASAATCVSEVHDAVLFVTARMARGFWKYQGLSYVLALRDAGALIQATALAATALDIAHCPIGLLPGDRFAELIGTDPWEEALVGGVTLNG